MKFWKRQVIFQNMFGFLANNVWLIILNAVYASMIISVKTRTASYAMILCSHVRA